jgi:hypothetical protein
MPGFLDAKERVIDMVLTDTGKSLLLKGDLQFVYWIPFDDEVDYDPRVWNSASLDADSLFSRKQQLTETPLIREATMGYRGLNLREEDTTNVIRPMYSAPPGVGQNYPLPQLVSSLTGANVQMKQAVVMKYFGDQAERIGVRRFNPSQEVLEVRYDAASYPAETQTEGFLVTMYQSGVLKIDDKGQSVGGYQEVLHNIDSSGSIAFLNDLRVYNYTP